MYKGQFKQDEFLDKRVFRELKNGVFVDVGAHDGISLSNTYFFEKCRNWSGVCIEPNPHVYPKLEKSRSCITLPYAVDCKDGIVDFVCNDGYTEMLSGIATYYDAQHHRRREYENVQYGGSTKIIQVPSKRLDTILMEHGITHVNYLSIDVEGGELAVLQSIDYDKIFIDVIDFECNNNELLHPIIKFLESKDFKVFHTMGVDVFMVHRLSQFRLT